MSWIVIGTSDEQRATFACDTSDRSFGPLHYCYDNDKSAQEELYEFGESLNQDPRSYDEDTLVKKYHDWLASKDF
jgi:hypothetical protein